MSDHEAAAGWYADPMRRYEERYWDGVAWTARVRRGLIEEIDLEWTEISEPVSRVATADLGAAPSSPGARGVGTLADQLARPRPRASTVDAVAAGGGWIALFGLLVAAGWLLVGDGDGGAPEAVLLGVLCIGVGYAVVAGAPAVSRAAALGGAVIGPVLVVGGIVSQVGSGRGGMILFGLLLGGAWLAMFLGPWFTGAPILLTGVLLAAWLVLVGVFLDPWAPSVLDPWADGPDPLRLVTSMGVVTLLCAVACVLAAAAADRRGMQVLGTPFLAVAVIQSAVGLVAATAELADAMAASLLSLVVGVLFVAVGSIGQRRGSLWYGTAVATFALGHVVANLVDDPLGGGILLMIVGGSVVLAAPAIERSLTDRQATSPEQPTSF